MGTQNYEYVFVIQGVVKENLIVQSRRTKMDYRIQFNREKEQLSYTF